MRSSASGFSPRICVLPATLLFLGLLFCSSRPADNSLRGTNPTVEGHGISNTVSISGSTGSSALIPTSTHVVHGASGRIGLSASRPESSLRATNPIFDRHGLSTTVSISGSTGSSGLISTGSRVRHGASGRIGLSGIGAMQASPPSRWPIRSNALDRSRSVSPPVSPSRALHGIGAMQAPPPPRWPIRPNALDRSRSVSPPVSPSRALHDPMEYSRRVLEDLSLSFDSYSSIWCTKSGKKPRFYSVKQQPILPDMDPDLENPFAKVGLHLEADRPHVSTVSTESDTTITELTRSQIALLRLAKVSEWSALNHSDYEQAFPKSARGSYQLRHWVKVTLRSLVFDPESMMCFHIGNKSRKMIVPVENREKIIRSAHIADGVHLDQAQTLKKLDSSGYSTNKRRFGIRPNHVKTFIESCNCPSPDSMSCVHFCVCDVPAGTQPFLEISDGQHSISRTQMHSVLHTSTTVFIFTIHRMLPKFVPMFYRYWSVSILPNAVSTPESKWRSITASSSEMVARDIYGRSRSTSTTQQKYGTFRPERVCSTSTMIQKSGKVTTRYTGKWNISSVQMALLTLEDISQMNLKRFQAYPTKLGHIERYVCVHGPFESRRGSTIRIVQN
eukprot:955083_1